MNPVETSSLSKQYGNTRALVDVDLRVESGECLGLVGPNGAGKTTLLKCVVGLIRRTRGALSVFDEDPWTTPSIRRRIGYLPENPVLYGDMTCGEMIEYSASLSGIEWAGERTETMLGKVGLEGEGRRRVSTCSKGMNQRLALACGLAHDPDLLVFDEPFSGLDPQGLQDWQGLLQGLKRDKTLLLSSHNLPVLERLSDRVALLNRGEVLALDTVETLLSRGVLRAEVQVSDPDVELSEVLEGVVGVESVQSNGRSALVHLRDPSVRSQLARRVVESGHDLIELKTVESDLEDLYERLVAESNETSGSGR